jgi:hypothetical protein
MSDPTYLSLGKRIDTAKETKLALTSEEMSSWVDKRNPTRVEAFHANTGAVPTTTVTAAAAVVPASAGASTAAPAPLSPVGANSPASTEKEKDAKEKGTHWLLLVRLLSFVLVRFLMLVCMCE